MLSRAVCGALGASRRHIDHIVAPAITIAASAVAILRTRGARPGLERARAGLFIARARTKYRGWPDARRAAGAAARATPSTQPVLPHDRPTPVSRNPARSGWPASARPRQSRARSMERPDRA